MPQIYTGLLRMCVRCREMKMHLPENFRTHRQKNNGKPYAYIKRVCAKCADRERVEYSREHSEHQNKLRRNSSTYEKYKRTNLKKYGMSLEDYNSLLDKQNGVCAICLTKEDGIHRHGRPLPLSVDHCHKTSVVRGLLCGACNSGLGHFRDDIPRLVGAISYLKGFRNG